MDEAVRAREASRYEVRDITPRALRDVIRDLLAETSAAPGALTLCCAGADERSTGGSALDERAAGVQLIYLGLSLTRSLTREDPWRSVDGPTEANMAVLAADVMVSRGFSLLARTEAADKAVETVRQFGRDETDRATNPEGHAANALERDIFELAAIAGTTAGGRTPSVELREYAATLGGSLGGVPIPDAEAVLTASVVELFESMLGPAETTGGPERAPHSSATDP